MLESGLAILKALEDKGFRAYLVGGMPRDILLNMDTSDVDITTNATPKDLIKIFSDASVPDNDYGSVRLIRSGYVFEIVTFRKEGEYDNFRRPTKVEYISSLLQDLQRRDFTINTICMDLNGDIIDLLNGREDLDKKLIRSIKDASTSFDEDPLRILRAIRFATVLSFNLDEDIIKAIHKYKDRIKILSKERVKFELDKMFISPNYMRGISLLKEFELDKVLNIHNLDKITKGLDLIAIWTLLDNMDYIKTSCERKLIKDIKEALNEDLTSPLVLFKYGGYVSQIAGILKGMPKKDLVKNYNDLPIKFKYELGVDGREIAEIKQINKHDISKYKELLIEAVLLKKVKNNKKDLKQYLEAL